MAIEILKSDFTLKSLSKPKNKTFRVSDGGGLYLLINPDGSKWWRLDYTMRETGRRKTLSLGVYPQACVTGVTALILKENTDNTQVLSVGLFNRETKRGT